MKLLGLDIGSNSVGSAWIDTEEKTIRMGVSVFPAGVEEQTDKRGAPKNQARRSQRQQRRSIERRAKLKRRLRQFLIKKNWIPTDKIELQKWQDMNPWILRKDALHRELKEYEFGRVLLHLAQRRGAWWFDEESEETESDKKKKKNPTEMPGTVEYTKKIMKQKKAETFGELIAIEYEERKTDTTNHKKRNDRVRNRNNAFGEKVSEYVADRHMILAEFLKIWETQRKYQGKLSEQLIDNVKDEIYTPKKTDTWRCQGVLFSQRKAYWDLGTLGRCDLEPTDEKCPKADMYAQEFLVLTSINNIRITPPAEPIRKLNDIERKKVVEKVRKQKTASESTIREALGINKGADKTLYTLNTDEDKFAVNGDWFYSQIASGVFGEDVWAKFENRIKESINRAILKIDPTEETDKNKLIEGCKKWWNLDDQQTNKFISAWEKRPKKDSRVNLSRKAIKNLLPYLREGWSVTEARDMYAADASNGADDLTRKRYSTKDFSISKRVRQFQKKHHGLLPPVSDGISNPVVRKSIHEVRKHLAEHIKQSGIPDRVIIELARESRQTEKVIAKKMQKDKAIKDLKDEIIKTHNLDAPDISSTQKERAIQRIRLCRQQREMCAYSGITITDAKAADGSGLEIDHIVPRSRGGDNSMSNQVLCYATANQGKGDRTPFDWLSETDFGNLEQRFKHLKPTEKYPHTINKDNVDMTDKTKWENLHRQTPKEGFTEEQLRSAAYAATQTTDWINKVLYGSEDRGKRYVYASNGNYTGILRRDWGLFFDDKGERSEKGRKMRGDHRHHAVDAAIIAMTLQSLPKIKQSFVDFEKQKEKKNAKPQWETINEPWDGFSMQIAEEYKKLNISHRAYNKKIAGYLHKDSIYGPAIIYERHQRDDTKTGAKAGDIKTDKEGNRIFKEGMYIKSICVIDLRGNHLTMPMDWDMWKKELSETNNLQDRRRVWGKMYAEDAVSPGKSGIIRDISLRNQIRKWLIENGIENIDNINKIGNTKTDELKKYEILIKEKGLVINGTLIKKIRLLWKLNEVKEIRRKGFDYSNSTPEEQRKSLRVYQTQNNHHIEIREKNDKKGKIKWVGDVVSNFDAAYCVRIERLKALKDAGVPSVDTMRKMKKRDLEHYRQMRETYRPIIKKINQDYGMINRNDTDKGRFVMSLSKGEIVHMRHPETQEAGYFVVFKIDSTNIIHFTAHTDANPASSNIKGARIREDVSKGLSPDDLRQNIIFNDKGVPEKVKISPLGEIKVFERD